VNEAVRFDLDEQIGTADVGLQIDGVERGTAVCAEGSFEHLAHRLQIAARRT